MSFVQNMSTRAKIGWGFLIAWLGGTIVFAIAYGITSHKAASIVSGQFSPIDEFRLDTWFKIGPIAINKGVLFILLAAVLTVGIMFWVARQMQIRRPNRVQVAVEWFYDFTRQMTSENMDDRLARKYFLLVATLFVFILVTTLIGYIPLP
ncbi:MAG: F0F1 ATP synthase subunit A, partial [Solirubrobacterales bacterium]|nr:F0F1 ATP synthase subunit A [Solirubrobacterales bacterium]